MYTIAKTYRFATAHTLKSSHLTPEENQRVYGKCANESGHGHDYSIEVRLTSTHLEDEVVIGHGILDQLMAEYVAPKFSYQNVNETLGSHVISSGENLAVAVHQLLRPMLAEGLTLEIRIVETEKNSFVYRGE